MAGDRVRRTERAPRPFERMDREGNDRMGGRTNFGITSSGFRYDSCVSTWSATANASFGLSGHTTVWTGTELIVWGGRNAQGELTNRGARYNPSTNSWTELSTVNAPWPREGHTAVWTGSEMIVWGGTVPSGETTNTGARYNPADNTWRPLASAPLGLSRHTAVWTNSGMIVWGGRDTFHRPTNQGARYDLSTDSWTPLSAVNAPSPREGHTAVRTDSNEMIIWGGNGGLAGLTNSGARYNPTNDSWTSLSTLDAPSPRAGHTAVWSGSEMIVWGGNRGLPGLANSGARYDPSADSWTAVDTTNAPSGREGHTAVWTGSEMIIWGGDIGGLVSDTGARYIP